MKKVLVLVLAIFGGMTLSACTDPAAPTMVIPEAPSGKL